MSNYQIAPYILQAKIRGSNPANARPLDNIDGSHTSLEEAVGNVLAGMLQRKTDFEDLHDANKVYNLASVSAGKNTYLLDIEPGRKGLQSRLKQKQTHVSRLVDDVEYVPLRHLIYFPPSGYTAIIFAERHGKYGAISFLRASMHQALTEKFPSLTFDMPSVTTLEALKHATYNKVVFQAPRKMDAAGRYLDAGSRVLIDVGFKKTRRVSDLIIDGGSRIDSDKVFGILTSEGDRAGVKAPLDTKGWDAKLTVMMQNGLPRTYKVGSSGPALVYQVNGATVNGTSIGASAYPSNDEFIGVCQTILGELAGQFNVKKAHKIPLESNLANWDGSQNTPWQVTHYDRP